MELERDHNVSLSSGQHREGGAVKVKYWTDVEIKLKT